MTTKKRGSLIQSLLNLMSDFEQNFDEFDWNYIQINQLDYFTYNLIEAFEKGSEFKGSKQKLEWFSWYFFNILVPEHKIYLKQHLGWLYENQSVIYKQYKLYLGCRYENQKQYKLLTELIEVCKSLNQQIATYNAIQELYQS